MILRKYGYPIDEKILSMIGKDPRLKDKNIDVDAPLGRNRKGDAQGRPKPAIITLSKSDIEYFKKIVITIRKQIAKSEGYLTKN